MYSIPVKVVHAVCLKLYNKTNTVYSKRNAKK